MLDRDRSAIQRIDMRSQFGRLNDPGRGFAVAGLTPIYGPCRHGRIARPGPGHVRRTTPRCAGTHARRASPKCRPAKARRWPPSRRWRGSRAAAGRPRHDGQRLPGPPRRRLDGRHLSTPGTLGGIRPTDGCRAATASGLRCDITYATANEIGFDFLRDRLALHPCDQVHRPSPRPSSTKPTPSSSTKRASRW